MLGAPGIPRTEAVDTNPLAGMAAAGRAAAPPMNGPPNLCAPAQSRPKPPYPNQGSDLAAVVATMAKRAI